MIEFDRVGNLEKFDRFDNFVSFRIILIAFTDILQEYLDVAHIGLGQQAILKRKDGKILKLIQPPPRGAREAKFYKEINSSNHPTDVLIQNCIPKFHGIEKIESRKEINVSEEFLILDDITEGFQLPTVMDIKVGKQTWSPDASEEKKQRESSKYCGTKVPFGFR